MVARRKGGVCTWRFACIVLLVFAAFGGGYLLIEAQFRYQGAVDVPMAARAPPVPRDATPVAAPLPDLLTRADTSPSAPFDEADTDTVRQALDDAFHGLRISPEE